jgi:predicted CopG family antitoxin
MHRHLAMPSKTISLENSAYEKLKAAKRADESFTDVVNRLVVGTKPSFNLFAGLLDKKAGAAVAKAFEKLRAEDLEFERKRVKEWKRQWG